MKSKISCFNKVIFKKNFTHFWPLWVLYSCYMIIILPVAIWREMSYIYVDEVYNQASRQFLAIRNVLSYALNPFPIFVCAVVTAMAVFSYLYTAKNANMIHSLPVDRRELFTTNFLSGMIFLVIPQIIAFIAAVFVCIGYRITSIEYLFLWLLCTLGMTFFAFSLAVFVAMFTGQLLAVPVYFFIVNYLFVGCLYIATELIRTICYGVSDAWNPGKSCILSPMYYLNNNLRCSTITNETTGQINGITVKGGYLIWIYAAAAVVIVVAAYQLYKHRQIETAGDIISIPVIKPVFRWGVAICGGYLLSVFAIDIFLDQRQNNKAFGILVLGTVILGFICFFGAEMLLQKNFKVFRKKRILEWIGFTVIAVAFLGLFRLDVFGIESKLPKAEEVDRCYISMDYPIVFTDAEIDHVISLHKQAFSDRKEVEEFLKDSEEYTYATFRYFLKDGSTLERNYPVPVAKEYLENPDSLAGEIIGMEQDEEHLKRYTFGRNYQNNDYTSGYMELLDQNGNFDEYRFDEEEMEQILQAVMADIEEGNYGYYQLYSLSGDSWEENEFYNGISFSFYNKDGVYFDTDEYYDYDYARDGELIIESGRNRGYGSAYICFGKKCTNLIDTLEKLGIINDEWKLYTYAEYEELMEW